MSIDELVDAANALIANAEPELVPVVLAGHQVGVRFLPMAGSDWRDLALKHPPRPDVVQDLNLGYNVDAVVSAYADVAIVNGDEVDDLVRVNEDGESFSKWPEVWKALTATGRKDVAAEIWSAHERTPERLVADAGKGSPAARKKKRG